MTSFFDKLKKGMGVENLSDLEEEKEPSAEEERPSQPLKEKIILKEDKTGKPSVKRKKEKKEKKKKKSVEVEVEDTSRQSAEEEKEWLKAEGELTVDIYQTEKDLVVQSVIAGINAKNLDISIENDMLLIKGIREKPEEKEKRSYFVQECYWGRFSREIVLPEEVDSSRIQASFKNGILTIRIPKIERKRERRVVINE